MRSFASIQKVVLIHFTRIFSFHKDGVIYSKGCPHPFQRMSSSISKEWSHPIQKGGLISSNSKGCSQSISKGWMVSSIQKHPFP
jgi:hypothetical protein